MPRSPASTPLEDWRHADGRIPLAHLLDRAMCFLEAGPSTSVE